MTTSETPIAKLRAQALVVAKTLKDIEAGNLNAPDPLGKIAESKKLGIFTAGIVMDDKLIQLEIEWAKIKKFGEIALAEYILKLMRGKTSEH